MSGGLKPCPFCGDEHPEITSGDLVMCGTETCFGNNTFDLWNNRTPCPDVSRLLVAAKEARSLLIRSNHPAAIQVARELLDAAIAKDRPREVVDGGAGTVDRGEGQGT